MRDRADNQSCANEEPANSAQEARNFKRLSCCPLLTVCYNDAAGDQDAGKSYIIDQFKERRKERKKGNYNLAAKYPQQP